MLIGACVGLLVDIFCNSLGVHTAACVLVMYLRPWLVNLYIADLDRFDKEISISSIGLLNFVQYALLLIVIHHIVVFFLTAWSVQHFWFTLLEIVVSTLMTFVLVMGYGIVQNR